MSMILFLVRKFCNVEIMPMVVVGRWQQKGGPHEPHPICIFQTIFLSNLITMTKRELRELGVYNIKHNLARSCLDIENKIWPDNVFF